MKPPPAIEYILSLGANQGDRLAGLRDARSRLAEALPCVGAIVAAPVYDTDPVDVAPAYRDRTFLNTVLAVRTTLAPRAALACLHAIEAAMGRRRGAARHVPRPIDIDIVCAGSYVLDTPDLRIPHPEWRRRRFVLQPLADIRPALVVPGQTRTVAALLAALDDPAAVRRIAETW